MNAPDKQNSSGFEPLHQVRRKDVPTLLKNLTAHGSEALTVTPVIATVLDWWEKNSAFRCTIYAPENGEDDGVCAMIFDEYDLKRILLFAPEVQTSRFLKCLEETKLIRWNSFYYIGRLVQRLKEPLVHILEAKGYTFYEGPWNYVMMMSPDDALALEENELPKNVFIRDLNEQDAPTLVKNWKYASVDSISHISDSIRYNGGLGAVDKDGELIGWIIWTNWGGLGNLFVSPSYRRFGLGRLLTIRMAKKIAKKGLTVTAEIESSNPPSFTLFQNIGFRYDFLDIYLGFNQSQ